MTALVDVLSVTLNNESSSAAAGGCDKAEKGAERTLLTAVDNATSEGRRLN